MRKDRLKYLAALLGGSLVIHVSCQKELTCPDCSTNRPPIALARPEQQSFLPRDSVILDGAASYDPDGSISSWLWTNISGPAPVQINNARSPQTLVDQPTPRVYHFVLAFVDCADWFLVHCCKAKQRVRILGYVCPVVMNS